MAWGRTHSGEGEEGAYRQKSPTAAAAASARKGATTTPPNPVFGVPDVLVELGNMRRLCAVALSAEPPKKLSASSPTAMTTAARPVRTFWDRLSLSGPPPPPRPPPSPSPSPHGSLRGLGAFQGKRRSSAAGKRRMRSSSGGGAWSSSSSSSTWWCSPCCEGVAAGGDGCESVDCLLADVPSSSALSLSSSYSSLSAAGGLGIMTTQNGDTANTVTLDVPSPWTAEVVQAMCKCRLDSLELRYAMQREQRNGYSGRMQMINLKYLKHLSCTFDELFTEADLNLGRAKVEGFLLVVEHFRDVGHRKLVGRMREVKVGEMARVSTQGTDIICLGEVPDVTATWFNLVDEARDQEGRAFLIALIHRWAHLQGVSMEERRACVVAARMVLLLGCCVDQVVDEGGRLDLILVAIDLGCVPILQLLLALGADYASRNADHIEPLLFIAQLGANQTNQARQVDLTQRRLDCFKCLLVKMHADGRLAKIAPRRAGGYNVLHFSAVYNTLDLLRHALLCGEFRDPVVLDAPSDTRTSGKKDVVDLRLVEGHTPLFKAVKYSNYDAADLLLEAGADPNVPCARGLSALHVAVSLAADNLVHLLLRHGANPNARDQDGKRPRDYLTSGRSAMRTTTLDFAVRRFCSHKVNATYRSNMKDGVVEERIPLGVAAGL